MSNSSMVIETVFTEGVAHLSYLIGDRMTGKAAVIDPRRDVEVLHFNDEAKFVEFVPQTAPPEPVYYSRMKTLNAEGPEVLGRLHSVPLLIGVLIAIDRLAVR